MGPCTSIMIPEGISYTAETSPSGVSSGQPHGEPVELVEVDLVVCRRRQLIGRDPEERAPERIQRVAAVHLRELHQPLAMVFPAALDRQRSGDRLAGQVHHPELPARREVGTGIGRQREQGAVTLQSVRLPQPADDYVGSHESRVTSHE